MTLREAWRCGLLKAADYDAHMAHIGQAEANAILVRELFLADPPQPGKRVWIAGAGTGQMFDYVAPALFAQYQLIATDINAEFLAALQKRVTCEAHLDDIETSNLTPGFATAILVLVLEHVDWRKAIATLKRLEVQRIIAIIQQNPPNYPPIMIGDEPMPILNPDDLIVALSAEGYRLTARQIREVDAGKRMLAFSFFSASPCLCGGK